MSEYVRAEHSFPAFFRSDSRILILGSFPSVKSREQSFYYAHPQNRFWRVLSECFGEDIAESTDGKKKFLMAHKIALWDVIESCDICGSSDSSIKNIKQTDIAALMKSAEVKKIILNGRTAEKYFYRFNRDISAEVVSLPSTSPANAAWSLERLVGEWRGALI